MTDAVLLDALDRLRGTGLEFDGFLANHGPMAAEALTRIGGSEAVAGWVDGYRRRLGPAPEAVRGIDDADWREHLGDGRLVGDWTDYMRRQARERSWSDLLLRWWPRLLLDRLARRAVEHGDEHVIKLTEAAVREFHRRGDTTLLVAADRFRDRVPPS
jgi:hypothetical protein